MHPDLENTVKGKALHTQCKLRPACPLKKNLDKLYNGLNEDLQKYPIVDIEELNTICRSHKEDYPACSYYYAKRKALEVDLILMPYKYLAN